MILTIRCRIVTQSLKNMLISPFFLRSDNVLMKFGAYVSDQLNLPSRTTCCWYFKNVLHKVNFYYPFSSMVPFFSFLFVPSIPLALQNPDSWSSKPFSPPGIFLVLISAHQVSLGVTCTPTNIFPVTWSSRWVCFCNLITNTHRAALYTSSTRPRVRIQ